MSRRNSANKARHATPTALRLHLRSVAAHAGRR